LKIAQVSLAPIPPFGYGGRQRIIFWLAKQLIEMGHEVVVVAPGERAACEALGIDFVEWDGDEEKLKSLIPKDVDIVHYHHKHHEKNIPDLPFVMTEHGNPRDGIPVMQNSIFISQKHANIHGSDIFVYNGIPVNEYPLQLEKQETLLFMALVAWIKKNVKTAINISLDLSIPIDVCGGDPWSEKNCDGRWKKRVARENKEELIRTRGRVGGDEKLGYLQNSGLLFYVVNWQEPFALAPHEALACGTPVLASPNGALPEYIVEGRNGYIVRSYEEAVDRVQKHFKKSDSERQAMAEFCRGSAFTIEKCAADYLEKYEQVLQKGNLYTTQELKQIRYRRKKVTKVWKGWFY
jgi:glycosyltransferase involved in cell wall biosynthesis